LIVTPGEKISSNIIPRTPGGFGGNPWGKKGGGGGGGVKLLCSGQ